MNEVEELARRVERHWGEESKKTLEMLNGDKDRLRSLVDGALSASRVGSRSSASPLLGGWTKGIVLCAVAAVLVSETRGEAVGDDTGARSSVSQVAPSTTPRASTTSEPAAISVADLPSAAQATTRTPARSTARGREALPSASPSPDGFVLSAPDLFARANEERRRGDLANAEADYRRLMNESPSSREALLAHVILGHMIEHRDFAAALVLFEGYLQRESQGEGVLAEEARTSRARLLTKLVKRREAVLAWRELLERHPDTVHRAEAEAGLRALDSASDESEN